MGSKHERAWDIIMLTRRKGFYAPYHGPEHWYLFDKKEDEVMPRAKKTPEEDLYSDLKKRIIETYNAMFEEATCDSEPEFRDELADRIDREFGTKLKELHSIKQSVIEAMIHKYLVEGNPTTMTNL